MVFVKYEMDNLAPEQFRQFLFDKHVAECEQCKKDGGKQAITDVRAIVLNWYKEFYDKYNNRK